MIHCVCINLGLIKYCNYKGRLIISCQLFQLQVTFSLQKINGDAMLIKENMLYLCIIDEIITR